MPSKPITEFAILDAWREQGADRINPLAFHYLVALQKRMATLEGDARRLLGEKLSARIEAYAEDIERTTSEDVSAQRTQPSTALAELTRQLDSRVNVRDTSITTSDDAPRSTLAEMGVLDDVRKLWSNVRASNQVRRSLEDSPQNTGPLNSSSLVHRALTLMSGASPGYVKHFMSYVDALSWLQHLDDHGVITAGGSSHPASGKPRPPRKARKRREPA
jgi:hypothetical protein